MYNILEIFVYLQFISKMDCSSCGHINLSHSWVPFGIKLNVSPITITPNHEANVLLGVVIKKDPPGYIKQFKNCFDYSFIFYLVTIEYNYSIKIIID